MAGAHPKVDAMLDEDPVAPREVNEADVTEVLEAEDPVVEHEAHEDQTLGIAVGIRLGFNKGF